MFEMYYGYIECTNTIKNELKILFKRTLSNKPLYYVCRSPVSESIIHNH